MCFAPQWCASSRHPNFQKWSEHAVYILSWKCALRHKGMQFFDFRASKNASNMVKRASRHNRVQFLTSELSKVLRACCLLHTLTWRHASRHNGVQFTHIRASKYAPNIAQCASRHNGVQFLFFIRQDGSAPAALASLLFDPPDPQIIGKTQCFATFLTFSRACIFFVFLSSTLVSSSLLSNFSHLCVSSFHIVRNLSSKLPWINVSIQFT